MTAEYLMRRAELRLDAVLRAFQTADGADLLSGPTPAEMVAAHEANAAKPAPSPASSPWRQQMRESWPEGKHRKRWLPWTVRR